MHLQAPLPPPKPAPRPPAPRPATSPTACGGYPSWPEFDVAAIECLEQSEGYQEVATTMAIVIRAYAGRPVSTSVALAHARHVSALTPVQRVAHDRHLQACLASP